MSGDFKKVFQNVLYYLSLYVMISMSVDITNMSLYIGYQKGAIIMNQTIQIDMESTTVRAYQFYPQIKRAAENAGLNLFSKYGVQIRDVQSIGEQVIMNATIPDEIADEFKLGYHLRGISAFLMKQYRETFAPLVVGKKLLNYTVIPCTTYNDVTEFTMNDRLSAISSFSDLMKHTDEASMNKINRILEILREE